MYKIDNKEVYTVYDRVTNTEYTTDSIYDLYKFIYSKVKKDFRAIDFSGADKETIRIGTYNTTTDTCYFEMQSYNKRYIIYKNGAIFDIRNYTHEYSKYIDEMYEQQAVSIKVSSLLNVQAGESCITSRYKISTHNKYIKTYKFRQEPVPYIHKRHKYSNYFRVPNIHRHLKAWAIEEYRVYTRKPNIMKDRTSLWWDDFNYRKAERSWKANKSINHQWQKHQK